MKTRLILAMAAFAAGLRAEVHLPALISDGMMMQRRQAVTLWGTADPGEEFTVSFRKKTYNVTATADGSWQMLLPPQKEGGPFTLTIGDKTVNDVMVGDVWLCSGQSNVDLMISRVAELYRPEVDEARIPEVRLLKVDNATDVHKPASDIHTSGWHQLEPGFAQGFSSLSYFLAKQMYEQTGIPQGVIACSWGGTPIQSWIAADSSAWQNDRRQQLLVAQDDNYVQSLRRTEIAYNRLWSGLMYASDPGRAADWHKAETDDAQWEEVNVRKDRWGKPGAGSWWLRQHVHVDAAHAGREVLLRVGTMVDADSTFVNGVCVGTTGYQYPPRRYRVPAGLLHEGDNVVCVRITTGGARPEFIFPKPYCLDYGGGDEIALSETWKMRRGAQLPPRKDYGLSMQNMPSACYNAMLHPLQRYALAGAVWYQGESNSGEPLAYRRLLEALMDNWRSLWKREDLPFFIVQLPDYMDSSDQPEESGWVSLRESQRLATVSTPAATIVTGLGLGERHDIHPMRKKEMAARIVAEIRGNGAPKMLDGEATVPDGGKGVVLSFSSPLRDGEVQGLELSADGTKFYNAKAVAKGKTLTVTCPEVPTPVAARYAWHNSPDNASLTGKNGQPVCTFEWKQKRQQ